MSKSGGVWNKLGNGPIDNTRLDEDAATQEDTLRLKPRNATVLFHIAGALSKAGRSSACFGEELAEDRRNEVLRYRGRCA